MANRYANLPGSSKISETYDRINEGFDKVEQDVDQLQDSLAQEITDREAAVQAVDDRVDTIINEPSPGKDAELVDVRTPAAEYTPLEPIDTAGGMTRDMQKQFVALKAETTQEIADINARQRTNQKARPLVTLVDDGASEEIWTRLKPVADQYNVPFAFGAVVDWIGQPGYLTLSQLLQLQSEGHEIASHSVTHTYDDDYATLKHEIVDSKHLLENLGLKIDNYIYPAGVTTETHRKLAKEVYASAVGTITGINTMPIKQYNTHRVALGSYFDVVDGVDTSTLDYYKSKVDEAIDSNGWLIFKIHVHAPQHDATQQQHLKDTIAYILSKGVDVVTIREGLQVFGNVLDVGDEHGETGEYTKLDKSGNLTSYSIPIVRHDTDEGVKASDPLSSFPRNKISYSQIRAVNATDFPEGRIGFLETNRIHFAIAYQLYHVARSNKIYKRWWDQTNEEWAEFERMSRELPIVREVLSFGKIDPQSSKDMVVTVAGASVSDFVNTSIVDGTWPPGLLLTGWVSNTDEVTLRILNVTDAEVITPANKVYRVQVNPRQ